jgi:hypothetical protein
MDAIVEQALAKWPTVPHCYGWLLLDARGNWRMRNEAAQSQNLPGEKIAHPALIGFINRNYTHDDQARWYFQNGPQRVYVDLEATPYIAHTEPGNGFVLQTGAQLTHTETAWLSDKGRIFLQAEGIFALLDDRDLMQCLSSLILDDQSIDDEKLMTWLDRHGASSALSLQHEGRKIPVNFLTEAGISEEFKFIRTPRAAI